MLNSDDTRDCNYQCNCGEEETEEATLPTMELPMQKECPRDCKREEMIMKVRELDFAVEDLALYLNTHPEDRKALCLHNTYAKQLKDAEDNKTLQYPIKIKCPNPKLAKVIISQYRRSRWRTCCFSSIFISKIWYARSKI